MTFADEAFLNLFSLPLRRSHRTPSSSYLYAILTSTTDSNRFGWITSDTSLKTADFAVKHGDEIFVYVPKEEAVVEEPKKDKKKKKKKKSESDEDLEGVDLD